MKVLLISQIATIDYKYTYSLANALKACGIDVELVIDDNGILYIDYNKRYKVEKEILKEFDNNIYIIKK